MLARALWREGYADHLAGHITVNLGDGTLLCNPWFITWDELRPSQLIRIDLDGKVIEGEWPAPLGIPLHLELHKLREDVGVAMHSHPLYGTVWADMGEVPPVYDQSSGLGGGGDLIVIDEYGGGVDNSGALVTQLWQWEMQTSRYSLVMACLFSVQRFAQFTSEQWPLNSAVNGHGISARLVAERNQQFLNGGSNAVGRATEMASSDFGKQWLG